MNIRAPRVLSFIFIHLFYYSVGGKLKFFECGVEDVVSGVPRTVSFCWLLGSCFFPPRNSRCDYFLVDLV